MQVYLLTKESTDMYNYTCIHSTVGVFTSFAAAKKVVIAARKAAKEKGRFNSIKYDLRDYPARLTYKDDIYFHDWKLEVVQTDTVDPEKAASRYLHRS